MNIPDNWRKSSYSGARDGNSCVETSTSPTHTAIRDSKTRTTGVLTFPRDRLHHLHPSPEDPALDGKPQT